MEDNNRTVIEQHQRQLVLMAEHMEVSASSHIKQLLGSQTAVGHIRQGNGSSVFQSTLAWGDALQVHSLACSYDTAPGITSDPASLH